MGAEAAREAREISLERLFLGLMHNLIALFLPTLYSVVGITGFVAIGVAAFGWIRKSQLEIAKQNVEVLEQRVRTQDNQISELKSTYQLIERRLYRVELGDQKKGKLLKAARQEIEMLNEIVRVAMTTLSRLNAEEKERVSTLWAELVSFRLRSQAAYYDWEEQQETALLLIDRQIDKQITPHMAKGGG